MSTLELLRTIDEETPDECEAEATLELLEENDWLAAHFKVEEESY